MADCLSLASTATRQRNSVFSEDFGQRRIRHLKFRRDVFAGF
jgi:hypothetical protein